jgi:hypothetical protein
MGCLLEDGGNGRGRKERRGGGGGGVRQRQGVLLLDHKKALAKTRRPVVSMLRLILLFSKRMSLPSLMMAGKGGEDEVAYCQRNGGKLGSKPGTRPACGCVRFGEQLRDFESSTWRPTLSFALSEYERRTLDALVSLIYFFA